MRLLQNLREGREPTLGLPVARVLAPKRLVLVARLKMRDDSRASGYDYFGLELPVATTNRLRERKEQVLGRTMSVRGTGVADEQNIERECTHVRATSGTGANTRRVSRHTASRYGSFMRVS